MLNMANNLLDDRFAVLWEMVQKINQGETKVSKKIANIIVSLDINKNPNDLKFGIFLRALLKQFEKNTKLDRKNLYLSEFDIDQIQLFDLMANKVPMVSTAGQLANNYIVQTLNNLESAAILDIGIGSGQQIVKLIEQIGANPCGIKKLKIIGIEPAAKSLKTAEKNIRQCSKNYDIKIDFTGINKCIENFELGDWQGIKNISQNLIINEAFALHHVKYAKNEILKQLKELEPIIFVLSEPNSDHHTDNFEQRFLNCWHHFGLVFEVIDKLEIYPQEKQAIKLRFFAREIEDILSTNENSRTERHETIDMWQYRLKSAGFKPIEKEPLLNIGKQDWVELFNNKKYIGLGIRSEPLVAIMAVC